MSRTWSLTVGNGGENHAGMQLLGKIREEGEGWDINKIKKIKKVCDSVGKTTELYNLNELCLEGINIPESKKPKDAYLLVVRGFINTDAHEVFKEELESYDWDIQYWDTRRSKVLNKHARANVCYGKHHQDPDYEDKKGTIISYDNSKNVGLLKDAVELLTGDRDLIVEGNRYDDVKKNGIGPHGDAERVCVACLRIGASMPMKFGMFHDTELQGKPFQTVLNGGDLYFMSEEAVGAKWRCRSRWIWRHAAGADKYLIMENNNKKNKKNNK